MFIWLRKLFARPDWFGDPDCIVRAHDFYMSFLGNPKQSDAPPLYEWMGYHVKFYENERGTWMLELDMQERKWWQNPTAVAYVITGPSAKWVIAPKGIDAVKLKLVI